MTKNLILVVVALAALTLPAIGGYGFDAGATCSDKTARRGRAQLLKTIPCDLSVQAYCNLPGTMYPWHAVRRFVNENQGMMKRMYGDVRHISVLRNEINNNDITLDDVEETAVRYSRAGWKRNKYLYQESSKMKNADLLSEAHYRRASTRPTGRSTPRNNARTTQRTSSTPSTTAETSVPSSTLSSTTETMPTKKTKANGRREKITSSKLTRQPETAKENSNDDPYEEVIEAAIEEIFDQFDNDNSNIANKNVFANVTEPEKMPIQGKIEPSDNIEIVGAPDLSATANKSEVAATISTTLRIYGYTKDEKTTMATPINTTIESTIGENRTESMYLKQNSTTPKSPVDDNLIHFEVENSDIDPVSAATNDNLSLSESTESITDMNDDGSDDDKPNRDMKPTDENTIGQLYQDVAQKEEPVLINGKGVNACPVKEEVVAPFWANNTRGEVLALLNLYPFEQYVHWEKCTQENKQMYCRDGCRCEQQYRLHRLLAYDPHNECRGIFSDWFRFPSCCICKCYNIPFEYRVTSRSPRSMGKNFKNDEDSYESNDQMDHNTNDEDAEQPENDDWLHKKNYFGLDDMFSEDIEL